MTLLQTLKSNKVTKILANTNTKLSPDLMISVVFTKRARIS